MIHLLLAGLATAVLGILSPSTALGQPTISPCLPNPEPNAFHDFETPDHGWVVDFVTEDHAWERTNEDAAWGKWSFKATSQGFQSASRLRMSRHWKIESGREELSFWYRAAGDFPPGPPRSKRPRIRSLTAQVSIDNGETWKTLRTPPLVAKSWTMVTVPLPRRINRRPVLIGFKYEEAPFSLGVTFSVDSVCLHRTGNVFSDGFETGGIGRWY